jgi:hypothetical protein
MPGEVIEDLEATLDAARAMLAALKAAQERFEAEGRSHRAVDDAIAQAEAAGIR